MKRITTLFLELVGLAAVIFLADFLQGHIDFIPKWAVRLPDVDYPSADFWTVFWYFLCVHLIVLLLAQLRQGPWQPDDARRTAAEIFNFGIGFAISSLIVFVTTTVAFDPQFVVGILICAVATLIVVHFIAALRISSISDTLLLFVTALLRRTFSITGVLAIVLIASPGVLAKLFTSDRDIANRITQVRIWFAQSGDAHWTVANALGTQTFLQPIQVQFPPHRSDRIYILERGGRLYRMPWGSNGEPELVLDISIRVGEVEIENGALGFTFDPAFGEESDNGRIYLYYTDVNAERQINRLSRFDLRAPDPAGSEFVLIDWNRRPDGFHNGGSVEFGPDGFLYLGVGEMSEVKSHQRVDRTLTSGILRLDVQAKDVDRSGEIQRQPANGTTQGYRIPRDNPLYGDAGKLGEFWAWGLRNPFRFSFDSVTGLMWLGDVGSTVWEEVNVIRPGHNYQFPYIEGREGTGKPKPATLVGKEQGPIYTYEHTAFERAVIGGLVYRGQKHPTLRGKYIFGDNYSGRLYAFDATQEQVGQVEELGQANQYAQRGITSITASPDGDVLLTTLGRATAPTGEVLRLIPKDQAAPDVPTAAAPNQEVSSSDAWGLFRTNCARCHGAEGRGDGPDAEHLGVSIPDFSMAAYQASRSDDELAKIIAEGGPAVGLSALMPPWKLALDETEIAALVKLIRDMEGQAE